MIKKIIKYNLCKEDSIFPEILAPLPSKKPLFLYVFDSFYFCISKLFLIKFEKKLFFFKLVIFDVFKLFRCVNIKNNFLKNKKYIILIYF
jgi:hypothetical protein